MVSYILFFCLFIIQSRVRDIGLGVFIHGLFSCNHVSCPILFI